MRNFLCLCVYAFRRGAAAADTIFRELDFGLVLWIERIKPARFESYNDNFSFSLVRCFEFLEQLCVPSV